jgi:hypothetical protein
VWKFYKLGLILVIYSSQQFIIPSGSFSAIAEDNEELLPRHSKERIMSLNEIQNMFQNVFTL